MSLPNESEATQEDVAQATNGQDQEETLSAAERMRKLKEAADQAEEDRLFVGLSEPNAAYLRRVFAISPGHSAEHRRDEDTNEEVCECPLTDGCPPTKSRAWYDLECRQVAALMIRVRADRIRNAHKYQYYTPDPGFRLEVLRDLLILLSSGHLGSRGAWAEVVKQLGLTPQDKDGNNEVLNVALADMVGKEAPAELRFPRGERHPYLHSPKMTVPGMACDGPLCGGRGDSATEELLAVYSADHRSHVAVDDIYAVAVKGPQVGRAVMAIDSKSASEFASAMMAAAYDKLGYNPGPTRISTAATLIRGTALRWARQGNVQRTPLAVRCVRYGEGYLIDLGTGRAVEVTEHGWSVCNWKPEYPVMRATARALPEPVRYGGETAGTIRRKHLSFEEDDPNWHQVRIWQAVEFFDDHERQHLFLTGGSGSGKSKRAQSIAAIIDPLATTADGRPVMGGPLPDDDALAPQLMSNYLFTSDNLTNINEEDSDRLCRIATGYRFTRRVLYTTSDLYEAVVVRAGLFTGISIPPQLREDAQNRILHLELSQEAEKRPSTVLDTERERLGGVMLAELLDDMVAVLKAWNAGQYNTEDRFPIVDCAAQVFGPEYVATRAARQDDLARNRAEGDTQLQAVAMVVKHAGVPVLGTEKRVVALTAEQWHSAIAHTQADPERTPKHWSPNANALAQRLSRGKDTLAIMGVEIHRRRSSKARWIELVWDPAQQSTQIPDPAIEDRLTVLNGSPVGPFRGATALAARHYAEVQRLTREWLIEATSAR
jgi:hypothetical protein